MRKKGCTKYKHTKTEAYPLKARSKVGGKFRIGTNLHLTSDCKFSESLTIQESQELLLFCQWNKLPL